MSTLSVADLQARLPELIASLAPGEEIRIVEDDRPVARLIGEAKPTLRPRQPGSAVAQLIIVSDDDDHLRDFAEYMPVKLLLDTHAFLWFVLNDTRLSVSAKGLIVDPANEVLLSPATWWEIAIKVSLGKYQLPGPFADFNTRQITANQLGMLSISVEHTALVAGLPFHHRDPFDHLLVAQALAESLPLVSADAMLDQYGVQRRW